MPVTRVGVGRLARRGADHLLEDQHVTDRERGDLAVERGTRRTFGQAAVLGAPGVELHPVVTLEERDVGERFEDLRPLRGDRPIRCREVHRRRAGDTAEEAGGDVGDGVDPREEDARGGHRLVDQDLDPRPGAAAVVHRVVDQTGVALDRDPPARGAQVRLGRDGVLAIGEVVADIRQQLDQRDPDVGHVPLAPVRIERPDPVEQEPPEGRVVACQVVEVDRRPDLGRTDVPRQAVEVGRAVDLEREVHGRQQRVETRRRGRVQRGGGERQPVDREVAGPGRAKDDPVRAHGQDGDPDVPAVRSLATADPEALRRQRRLVLGGERVDERDAQPSLPQQPVAFGDRQGRVLGGLVGIELARREVGDLEEVDAVQAGRRPQGRPPMVGAAGEDRAGHVSAPPWRALPRRSVARCSGRRDGGSRPRR